MDNDILSRAINYGALNPDTAQALFQNRPELFQQTLNPGFVPPPQKQPELGNIFNTNWNELNKPIQLPTYEQPSPSVQAPTETRDIASQPATDIKNTSTAAALPFNLNTNLDEAFKMKEDAILDAGAAQANKNLDMVKELQLKMQTVDKMTADQEQKQQERKKQLESMFNQVEQVKNDIPDLKDYWDDKTVGQKLIASLALGLGAFGAAARGGPNSALQYINGEIDRDLQRQKANIAKSEGNLEFARGRYKDFLQLLGDERQADLAFKASVLQNLELKLKGIEMTSKAFEVKADAKGKIADLEMQRRLYNTELAKNAATKLYQQQARQGKAIDKSMLSKEDQERYVEGYGIALNKEAANKFIEAAVDAKSTQGALGRLYKIANTPGAAWNQKTREDAKVLTQQLIGTLRLPLQGPGAMTEKEREILLEILPQPGAIFSLNVRNKQRIQSLLNASRDRIAAHAQLLGFEGMGSNSGIDTLQPGRK